MLHERENADWEPVILQTIATQRKGVEPLIQEISRHKTYLKGSDKWSQKRQERNWKRLQSMIQGLISEKVKEYMQSDPNIEQRIANVRDGQLDPFTVAHDMVDGILGVK